MEDIEIKVEECAECETGEIIKVIVTKNGAGGEEIIPREKMITHIGKIQEALKNRTGKFIKLPETSPFWPSNEIVERGGYGIKELCDSFFIP